MLGEGCEAGENAVRGEFGRIQKGADPDEFINPVGSVRFEQAGVRADDAAASGGFRDLDVQIEVGLAIFRASTPASVSRSSSRGRC